MTKQQISILSTDNNTLKTFATTLNNKPFYVEIIGAISLESLLTLATDVILIDEKNALNMSALDICKIVRTKNEEVIIIILTDDFDISEKIIALEAGADDYLAKPVNRLEIMARIKVTLKRMQAVSDMALEANEFKFNDLYLDAHRHVCMINGINASLTNHEFRTLLQLVQNNGKTVSRATLLSNIWGLTSDEHTRPVDDVVRRLRKKLNSANSSSQILSHWGHGYRVERIND